MSAVRVAGLPIQRCRLLLAMLIVALSLPASGAAAIDLSRFNGIQIRIRTDFELTWVNTLYDGSQTTERTDHLSYDTQDEAFKRGHFDGDTYTAGWNEEVTVSPGKIWKLNGSVSLTLSATDPPAVTAFRIEDFSDYPGSKLFSAHTTSFLIEGPRTDVVIPLVESSSDTLVFRVTGPASCNAFTAFSVVYEYPVPTNDGVVRTELIPPSTCTSTGIEVYFEIDLWALPPLTPSPTRTATATATSTPSATATPSATPTQTPTATATHTATPDLDLIADGLEVVQTIQDLDNHVRLVANKRTFVRFHVHANRNSAPVGARLWAQTASGVATVEPISSTPGGTGAIRVLHTPQRAVLDHAFLFELPDGYREGSMTLTAVVNPSHSVPESDSTNNERFIPVKFEPVAALDLILYDIGYESGGRFFYPREVDRANLRNWLQRAYPVAAVHVTERREIISGPGGTGVPSCGVVDARLEAKRIQDHADNLGAENPLRGTHYYGMVHNIHGFMRGCSVDIPSFVASGPTGTPDAALGALFGWDPDASYGDWYGGHELGHTWGRRHVVGPIPPCQAVGGAAAFPNPNGSISPHTPPNRAAIYGLDSCYGTNCGFSILNTGWRDVMTYCPWQWPSDFTYSGLLDTFRAAAAARGGSALQVARADRLLISGVIDFDAGTVHVEPMFVLPDAPDIEPRVPGQYAIVLRSASLTELARYAFTPSESQEDPVPGTTEPGHALGFFSELVPYVDGTAVVDIEGPDGLLHRVSAGSRTPTVRVTAPNGGEHLSGDTLEVGWTASDADGDPLVFKVQYSADDGASWEVVAQDISDDHVAIDRINLAASTHARVRVWVSDGIHTAWDDSDAAFELATAAPSVVIVSPAQDLTVAAGQTVQFGADAADPDLGGNVGEHVEWRSSRDGLLGTGTTVSTVALSRGTHAVTVRVDDGAGGVATDSVQVTVVDDASQLPPLPDALRVAPAPILMQSAGSSAWDVLYIDNQNLEHSIAWQAAVDVPWLEIAPASGTTPAAADVRVVDRALLPGMYNATITVSRPGLPGSEQAVAVALAVHELSSCPCDCDGNGAVTVDEIIMGVDIAMDMQELGACPVFDANRDGAVTVDEIVQGVNAALRGCPTPTPTVSPGVASPTRTRTPTPTVSPAVTPTPTATRIVPSATATPTGILTTLSPTPTTTPTPTRTCTATRTPTPTRIGTSTPTPTPSASPTFAPMAPVVAAFTCDGFPSCVVEIDESFTLQFSFTDVNGNASNWYLTARRDDGTIFDMDEGPISPPSGNGTITRISPGFSCPSGNCRNSEWQIRVMITDTTELQSQLATVDISVLAVIP